MLIRDWIRLFNLDRGASAVSAPGKEGKEGKETEISSSGAEEKKRDREHKPSRKAAMKFEDLRMDAASEKKMVETASNNQGQQAEKAVFKLTPAEVYTCTHTHAHIHMKTYT